MAREICSCPTHLPTPHAVAARETIYILDWWLSPELYLRRPPSRYEEYRLDRMLKAAAERGVQVYVIVYKEVPQALTRKLDSWQYTVHGANTDGRSQLRGNMAGFTCRFQDAETVASDSTPSMP